MVQFDVTAVDAAQAQAFASIMSGGLTGPAMLQCLQQARLLISVCALMRAIKPLTCVHLLVCLSVCVHLASCVVVGA